METPSDLICVGAIAGAFGVHGEVRLKSFTAETILDQDGYPALVRSLGESWQAVAEQIADQLRQGGHL